MLFRSGKESVEQFVENGYIEDLQPILDKKGISTDGMLAQEALDSYRYDGDKTGSGDLYALPKDASVFAYAYNKDLFDEAGLDYPDPENPYTYDEFVEVCKKLTKDTDGDGLYDVFELAGIRVQNGQIVNTRYDLPDTDKDGLKDGVEIEPVPIYKTIIMDHKEQEVTAGYYFIMNSNPESNDDSDGSNRTGYRE